MTEVNKESQKSSVSQAASTRPWIFAYLDYRQYLKDWFDWKRSMSRSYSGAVFAKQAGLKSHTLLTMVIRGERNLTFQSVRSFAKALDHTAKEKLYFEKLVLYTQARSAEDRAEFLSDLASLSSHVGGSLVTRINDLATYLSHWYVVAIRELVLLKDFNPDPAWMADKLKKRISKKQALEAFTLLQNLGMIDLKGETWCQVHSALDFESATVDFAIRNFHKDFIQRALDSVEGEGLHERELSSLTIALSSAEFDELKEKIREFRKEINLKLSAQDLTRPKEVVVAWNTQLLTLTQTNDVKGKTP